LHDALRGTVRNSVADVLRRASREASSLLWQRMISVD
jgi:hypothetical protein